MCGLPLSLEPKRAVCPKTHHFDRAKEGYFNLLCSSASHAHGDDKAMLRARRLFLEKGYYEPLRRALCDLSRSLFSSGDAVVDAGCGEGYYTEALAEGMDAFFAFDVAKEAARMTAKKLGGAATVFVGSAYRMPFAHESLQGIWSLFAPLAEEEFLRVLKKGGYLVRVYPLPEHLFALKQAVYDEPRIRSEKPTMSEDWALVSEQEVHQDLVLPCQEDIRALFGMTPYAHKTGREDMEKLFALETLSVESAFGISVFQKKS